MKPITTLFGVILLPLIIIYSAISSLTSYADAKPSLNLIVNSTLDAVDANPGDGVCETAVNNGICTLRAAVQEANAFSGDDTILLPEGTYQLTIAGANEDAAAMGDLDITDTLIIQGSGPKTTIIDGNNLDRIFHVSGNFDLNNLRDFAVEFHNMSLENGFVSDKGGAIRTYEVTTLSNMRILNNSAGDLGGGVYAWTDLAVISSTISHNGAGSSSGGILVVDDYSIVTVSNSIINHNIATNNAGGIGIGANVTTTIISSQIISNSSDFRSGGIGNSGHLVISDSVIAHNSAGRAGGGVDNHGLGIAEMSRSVVTNNSSFGPINTGGGGIFNEGVFTLRDSTVSDNQAEINGGGIYNLGEQGDFTIINSTISNNSAGVRAGGIYNSLFSHAIITNSSIISNALTSGIGISNSATSYITFTNSLIAYNGVDNCSGAIASQGHNLSSDGSCNFNSSGDLVDSAPLIGPLADNGGATWTHALLPNSPAIDAANNLACPAFDQRGWPRPADGNSDGSADCDIGAYEVNPNLTIPQLSLTAVTEPDSETGTAVFTVSLSPATSWPVYVTYHTQGHNAVANIDFIANSGTLLFAPGDTVKTVSVDIVDDATQEAPERFKLILQSPHGASILQSELSTTIPVNDISFSIFLPAVQKS